MEFMVIKVCGIPDVDIGDRMLDKLKIHFQRHGNSGADVLTVLPASTPDQAYVVFETKEVHGVLQCNHVLEVDSRFYPIHVQEVLQSEVDMTVKTKLSLRMFSNPQDVYSQLRSNGFKMTEISQDLHLEGSFLSLMLSRKQLACLQVQDIQPNRTSSSSLFNGYSSTSVTQIEPNHLEYTNAFKALSNRGHVISNGVHTGSRRPMVDAASPLLAVSPASFNILQSSSADFEDSGSAGSPRSPTSYDSHSKPPSTKRKEARLLVDKDVLDYAFKYEEDVFKGIEQLCELSVKDDKDVSTVMFLGNNCEKAKLKLQACIEKIRPLLCAQKIFLNSYDLDQQAKIHQRIQFYQNKISGVIIKHDGETVKLVGFSKTSFEIKQKLLGHIDGSPRPSERGRTLERKSTQRSLSVPRQYKDKGWGTDEGHHAEPNYSATASNYQEELQPRRAQGRLNEPQSRRRSNSESRDKNKASRLKPKPLEEVPSPNRDEEKGTNKYLPAIKKTMLVKKLHPKHWKLSNNS